MPQGVGGGSNYLAPGRVRAAGGPAPLNGGLLTKNPIRFPAASTLYVRKTGSDNNGGSSVTTSPDATGTDGVTDGTEIFTAASGAFSGAYVDELINIVGVGRFRIEEVIGATTLRLSKPTGAGVAGSGKTWNVGGAVLTIGALMENGNDAVREGDTVWVGAGTYRETVTFLGGAKNGATSAITVRADVDGVQTGDPGMVQVTSYTTDDKTLPSGRPLLWFGSGVGGYSFSNFFWVCGPAPTSAISTRGAMLTAGGVATNQHWQANTQGLSFTDCSFLDVGTSSSGRSISVSLNPGYPPTWTFTRCRFRAPGVLMILAHYIGGTAADLDLAISFDGCFMFTGGVVVAKTSSLGSGTNPAGGVRIKNSTIFGDAALSISSQGSVVIPCELRNSVAISSGTNAVASSTLGNIIEDYNFLSASVARATVAVGAHTISDGSYACLYHLGQETQWGALLRPHGEPMAGSPLAGFGNDGTQSAFDALGRPRPAGGGNALPAIGALERGNSFAKETGTVHTGSNAISATGPAYQDFLVPVASGTSYTISVYVAYDGSYTGTAPQIKLVNGTEAGVTDQTVTAGGSAGGGFVQVSLALFTPTSSGFVTVRVQSNDTSGVSETVFDSFAVA